MEISAQTVVRRNNVNVSGSGDRAMMFAHGFGCDQTMWKPVALSFEQDFRVVLFDYVGRWRTTRCSNALGLAVAAGAASATTEVAVMTLPAVAAMAIRVLRSTSVI
jgi:pimeloyl-ACP methyl ester carboxylesterase